MAEVNPRLLSQLNRWLSHETAAGTRMARRVDSIADEFTVVTHPRDKPDKPPGFLGKGSYGSVIRYKKKDDLPHLAHIPSGPVAIKTINKTRVCCTENALRHMMVEILVLRKLRHPHIIKLYDVVQTDDQIFLIMELCEGGELYFFIADQGKCTVEDAALILKQILMALAYCHENGVVHRDIKPENIVIDPDTKTIKLIDFGLAKYLQRAPGMPGLLEGLAASPAPHGMSAEGRTPGGTTVPPSPLVASTPCGTELYMSLESIRGILHGTGRNKWLSTRGQLPKVDVYAAGVIGYAMLTGRLPYKSGYRPGGRPGERHRRLCDLEHKMYAVEFPFPRTSQQLPLAALECIRDLMSHDIHARLTAALGVHHPWLAPVATPGAAVEEPTIEVAHRHAPKPAAKPAPKRPTPKAPPRAPIAAPLPVDIVSDAAGSTGKPPQPRHKDPQATPIVFVDDEQLQEANRATPANAKGFKAGWKEIMRGVRGAEDDDVEEKDSPAEAPASPTEDTAPEAQRQQQEPPAAVEPPRAADEENEDEEEKAPKKRKKKPRRSPPPEDEAPLMVMHESTE